MRVLLVDDNEVAGKAIAWALSEEGYSIAFVSLGRQVPGMVAHFKPDVVVMDVNLADLNGMLVAELLRKDWPNLPIIFATGSCDPTELPVGAEYLMKPFSIDALVEAITRLHQRSPISDL